MKRRFIVAISGLNKEDQKKFMDFVREHKMSWWHWIDEFWLLTEKRGEITATRIRDFLRDLPSSRRCIVLEMPVDNTWAGFGPDSAPQEMFRWVKTSWKED